LTADKRANRGRERGEEEERERENGREREKVEGTFVSGLELNRHLGLIPDWYYPPRHLPFVLVAKKITDQLWSQQDPLMPLMLSEFR
jgi:hypothetical protein